MTEELKAKIMGFKQALDKGWRVSGKEVTDAYTEATGKHVPSTNCASCLRRRIAEMYNLINEK